MATEYKLSYTGAQINSKLRQIEQLSSEKADKTEVATMVETEVEDIKGIVVQAIIEELHGLPIFGVVDENNIVKVTSLLANGTYTLKYENTDGSTTELGTIVVGDGTGDGSGGSEEVKTYEVDVASIGYTDNRRWSISSGELSSSTATGFTAINLIPINRSSGETVTIELSGIDWVNSTNTGILWYSGDPQQFANAMYFDTSHDYSDVGFKSTCHEDGRVTIEWFDCDYTGFKLNGLGSGANAKITITGGVYGSSGGEDIEEPDEPTVYEVDIASIGYTDGARWSTSGGDIRTNIGIENTAINLVPFTRESGQTMTIHLSGITWTGGANVTAILFFTDGTYEGSSGFIPLDAAHNYTDNNGGLTIFNSDGTIDVILTDHPNGKLYNGFKVCGTGSGANAKITYTIS